MKIVDIFAGRLYAFLHEGEAENEYSRLVALWSDISYLWDYAKANNIKDIKGFANTIQNDLERIEDWISSILISNEKLESFFRPLDDMETGTKVLSLQKGKIKKSYLRFYAIRIDENLFVITGGAIKLFDKMNDHEDTQKEKQKLTSAKNFLRENGVLDSDSFYEFLIEL